MSIIDLRLRKPSVHLSGLRQAPTPSPLIGIKPTGNELFGLAGIAELWKEPESPLHTVSLITTEPNDLMRTIHVRMPVIMSVDDYGSWLDPKNQDTVKLKNFIRPFPAELMTAYPVSTKVNNAKTEGKELGADDRRFKSSRPDQKRKRAAESHLLPVFF